MKGNNTKSIRKKNLENSRIPLLGSKNLKFFHQSIGNEEIIDITNITSPTGYINPSPSEIASTYLKVFSNNVSIYRSSANGKLIEKLSYTIITDKSIRLISKTLPNEIFEIVFNNKSINGTIIADVRTPSSTGTLLEGQRDFNLGEAIKIGDLNNQFPITVLRGDSGSQMLRNEANAAFVSDANIGNYQMIDRGDGYAQVIKFNDVGDVGDETIAWASHGALGERPDVSTLQHVDKLNGIVDTMREDLLSVTGYDVTNPTRYDGGVPTNSDLRSFGDTISKLLNVSVFPEENNFGVSFDQAGVLISRSNSDLSTSRLSTGSYIITAPTGFFGELPVVVPVSNRHGASVADAECFFDRVNSTLTTLVLICATTAVVVDSGMDVCIQRTETDYKHKVKLIDLI